MTSITIDPAEAAAFVGAGYVLRRLPCGKHQWTRFPRASELEAILARRGFSVEDRVGVGVNPLNRRFRLHKYLGVNHMLVTRRNGPDELSGT